MLDSALVLWFPAPKSFTGEDVVEFHLHGSLAVLKGIFEAFEFIGDKLDGFSKIRPAERGEFTRRAFDNGKMDLTEVEGLADLLEAETGMQRPPNAGKSSILNALARRPAAIVSPSPGTTRDVVDVRLDLGGIPCTLSDTAGLRDDTATTVSSSRDNNDAAANSETERAHTGLSDGGGYIDPVEREGMRRSRAALQAAHICVFVADMADRASLEATRAIIKDYQEDVQRTAGAEGRGPMDRSSMVVVLNKADKTVLQGAVGSGVAEIDATNAPTTPWPCPSLQVSCVTGQGLEDLEVYLGETVTSLLSVTAGGAGVGGGYGEGQGALITRERHRSHVKSCVWHLDVFLASQRRWERATSPSLAGRDDGEEEEEEEEGVEEAVYLDAAAEELRLAMQDLGRVTGRVDVEELLDVIFRDFCIG
eukprot:gene647-714_t